MLGYVICERPELKMKEYEVYQGYYCGICKSVGRRYGQLPRAALSYDAAFLACMLSSLLGEENAVSAEHCVVHRFIKKPVIRGSAVDYAADVMVILARWNALDDMKDDPGPKALAAAAALKRPYAKAKKLHPELAAEIKSLLRELSQLEYSSSPSIDASSDCFGRILEAIFTEGAAGITAAEKIALRRFARHLGKWIYLIDAADDIESDIEKGNYNPFLLRYGYDPAKDTPADFITKNKEEIESNLLILCSEMSKAADLLDIKKNVGIIDNVIKMGLLRSVENVLGIGIERKNDGNESI